MQGAGERGWFLLSDLCHRKEHPRGGPPPPGRAIVGGRLGERDPLLRRSLVLYVGASQHEISKGQGPRCSDQDGV